MEPTTDRALSDISFGLDHIPDDAELVERQNNNIRNNLEGKENVLWPNPNISLEQAMAKGLEALDALSQNDYAAAEGNIPNEANDIQRNSFTPEGIKNKTPFS